MIVKSFQADFLAVPSHFIFKKLAIFSQWEQCYAVQEKFLSPTAIYKLKMISNDLNY